MEILSNTYLNTDSGVVWSLFNHVLATDDLLLRPATKAESEDPGTIVSIVRRAADGTTVTEDIFTPCDFETFSSLVRGFQTVKKTHIVAGDRFTTFAYAKKNYRTPAVHTYESRVA